MLSVSSITLAHVSLQVFKYTILYVIVVAFLAALLVLRT